MTTPDTFAAGIEAAARWHDEKRHQALIDRAKSARGDEDYNLFTAEALHHAESERDIRALTVKDERDDG